MSIVTAPSSGGTFAALAVPNFRRFVSGQGVSLIGTWTETVAQALLVLRLSHSGTVLGLITAARFAPTLLLSPYGGVLADRYPKRRLLFVTQVGLALVSLTLGLLVITNAVRLWQVALLATLFGVLAALDNPTRLSFVGEMVDRQLLRDAVTLNTTMVNVARAIGPAVAGVLVITVGLGACFLVNAASFVAVVLALATLDASQLHPAAARAPARGWLRDGLRYARARRVILAPLLMMTLIGTFAYEFEVSLPLLARSTFHGGTTAYSWLLGAFGCGAIFGALRAAKRAATGIRALVGSATGFGLATLAVALAPSFWIAVALLPLVGATSVTFLITGNSTAQLAAAPEFRGRVTALWSTALVGSTPIGAPIVGLIADHFGPRSSLALGAASCGFAALVGLALLHRGARSPSHQSA
ncbi:MAG TPA: MFS transporter [Solirubrobacteraceae bacterium]|nr:MFS transporter [Solirubrobacteraceae bacterium]